MTAQPTPEPYRAPQRPFTVGVSSEAAHEDLLSEVFDAPPATSAAPPPVDPRPGYRGRHAAIPPVPDLAPAPAAPVQHTAPPPLAPVPARPTSPAPAPALRQVAPATPRDVVDPGRSGRIALGTGLLAALTALLVVGSFVAMQALFPWMTLFDHQAAGADAPAAAASTHARTVSAASASPAEQVLDDVSGFTPGAVRGWEETKATKTVPTVSLGFGCDPTDGLAAVVARNRSWSKSDGSASLSISARSYPAGTGALAIDGIRQAALTCDAATVTTPAVALGVEATQVYSRRVASLVWRRGDVVMIASTSAYSRAGNPGSYAADLHTVDDRLDHALSGVCINQDAPVTVSARSPYVAGKAYQPYTITETVTRPTPTAAPAATSTQASPGQPDVTAPTPSYTPVPIPAPEIDHPDAGDLPTKPNPAPTSGPSTLPAVVPVPETPKAPTKPAGSAEVPRRVADTSGPGCGWAFTGQRAPAFDSTKAEAEYARAATKAEDRLTAAWSKWQQAKIDYYIAYAAYQQAVASYASYADQVAEVRDAWNAIDEARQDYYDALKRWRDDTTDAKNWKRDYDKALAKYAAAQNECAQQVEEPTPTTAPSATPTTAASPGATPTASPTATASPTSKPTPALTCPPVRPSILDAQPPTPGASPTPAAQAQLR